MFKYNTTICKHILKQLDALPTTNVLATQVPALRVYQWRRRVGMGECHSLLFPCNVFVHMQVSKQMPLMQPFPFPRRPSFPQAIPTSPGNSHFPRRPPLPQETPTSPGVYPLPQAFTHFPRRPHFLFIRTTIIHVTTLSDTHDFNFNSNNRHHMNLCMPYTTLRYITQQHPGQMHHRSSQLMQKQLQQPAICGERNQPTGVDYDDT